MSLGLVLPCHFTISFLFLSGDSLLPQTLNAVRVLCCSVCQDDNQIWMIIWRDCQVNSLASMLLTAWFSISSFFDLEEKCICFNISFEGWHVGFNLTSSWHSVWGCALLSLADALVVQCCCSNEALPIFFLFFLQLCALQIDWHWCCEFTVFLKSGFWLSCELVVVKFSNVLSLATTLFCSTSFDFEHSGLWHSWSLSCDFCLCCSNVQHTCLHWHWASVSVECVSMHHRMQPQMECLLTCQMFEWFCCHVLRHRCTWTKSAVVPDNNVAFAAACNANGSKVKTGKKKDFPPSAKQFNQRPNESNWHCMSSSGLNSCGLHHTAHQKQIQKCPPKPISFWCAGEQSDLTHVLASSSNSSQLSGSWVLHSLDSWISDMFTRLRWPLLLLGQQGAGHNATRSAQGALATCVVAIWEFSLVQQKNERANWRVTWPASNCLTGSLSLACRWICSCCPASPKPLPMPAC